MYQALCPQLARKQLADHSPLVHPAWAGSEFNQREGGGRGRGRAGRREGGGRGDRYYGFTFSRDLKLLKGKFAKLIALLIR